MKRLILIMGTIWCHAVFAGPSAEKIFADARAYTAVIETRIETPFVEDTQSASLGAGFVVDRERRWLLTNAHVSGRSPAHITAMFDGAKPVGAWPVYIDPYLDLAILEYDAGANEPTQTARLDCGRAPATGHPVGAFGHPNGLKFTGTRGVVSGRTHADGSDWLQTDAPINHGNSGGPLISLMTGRVVGINTAFLADPETQNANFAVLALQACRVIGLLEQGADPRPADLGVSFFREGDEDSLRVAQVFSVGVASGLHRGDVILGLARVDERPESAGQLIHLLRGRSPGARLQVIRAGKPISLDAGFPLQPGPLARRGLQLGGALFAASNQTDIEGLVAAPPVMVHSVADGSAADLARLRAYDHLVAVDGMSIRSLAELQAAVRAHAADESVELELIRVSGDERRFTIDLLARLPAGELESVAFQPDPVQRLSRVK